MTRRIWLLVALAIGLTGCGGTSDAADTSDCPLPNPMGCAQAQGVYSTSYSERSGGTCGSMPPVTHTVAGDRATKFTGTCPADIVWSSDFCMASFEVSCTEEDRGAGFTNEQVSHTTYSVDGMSRTGVFELTIFDAQGNPYCQSTYDTLSLNTSCSQTM